MSSLDYFLEKKWFKKVKNKINNDRYLVHSVNNGDNDPNFNWIVSAEADRYLFDYSKAFGLKHWNSSKELLLFELFSLLIVNGDLKETNSQRLKKIFLKVEKECRQGQQFKTLDENKIFNLIEALDLVGDHNFALNRDNFEILIRIIFRNLHVDVDNPEELLRTGKDKQIFKNICEVNEIKKHLEIFFVYLDKIDKQKICGYTQSGVILLSFLYISPYKTNNILIAFILSKWYLRTLDNSDFVSEWVYSVIFNWTQFVKTVDEAFLDNFNFDKSLKLIFDSNINAINVSYRLKLFDNWIQTSKEFSHIVKILIPNFIDKIILIRLLGSEKNLMSKAHIKIMIRIAGKEFFKDEEIFKIVDRLLEQKIIVKVINNEKEFYKFNEKEIIKIKYLVKDK